MFDIYICVKLGSAAAIRLDVHAVLVAVPRKTPFGSFPGSATGRVHTCMRYTNRVMSQGL